MTNEIDQRLLGRWTSEPDESGAGRENAVVAFLTDGSLTYSVVGKGSTEVMRLTFDSENGVIVSDQPSSPRQERAPYPFTEDGKLILTYGGEPMVFSRGDS